MRFTFSGRPVDHEHACRMLEALLEGAVRSAQEEIRTDPEAFPCCIKCGGFKLQPAAFRCTMDGTPFGDLPDYAVCQAVDLRSPKEVARDKWGDPYTLAVYAAAQKREHDKDDTAIVVLEHVEDDDGKPIPGVFRPMLLVKGGAELEDPLEDAQEVHRNGCACLAVAATDDQEGPAGDG